MKVKISAAVRFTLAGLIGVCLINIVQLPGASVVAQDEAATISVVPNQLELGQSATVEGHNFPGRKSGKITIEFEEHVLAEFRTNQRGEFRVRIHIPVMVGIPITLTADVDGVRASALVEIHPGTGQPLTSTQVIEATETLADTPQATDKPTQTLTPQPPKPRATDSTIQTQTIAPTKTPTLRPGISLSASSGVVGSNLAIQIRNFRPNIRVAIYFNGARKFTFTTDASGGVRQRVALPDLPFGEIVVRAKGGGREVTTPFTVKPTLIVKQSTVVAGRNLSVRVTGFPALTKVTLRIYDAGSSNGYQELGSISTNTKGTGKGTLTVSISTKSGQQTVIAINRSARASVELGVKAPMATRTSTPKTTSTRVQSRTPTPKPAMTATQKATTTPAKTIQSGTATAVPTHTAPSLRSTAIPTATPHEFFPIPSPTQKPATSTQRALTVTPSTTPSAIAATPRVFTPTLSPTLRPATATPRVPTSTPSATTRVVISTPRTATATPARTPAATSTPGKPSGRTFYISSAHGNDNNDGLSTATPWRSLSPLNRITLAAGESVLLERGSTWGGSIQVSRSGTSNQPIRIGAYGEGNRPILQGPSDCVLVTGSFVVIEDIQTVSCGYSGIVLRGDSNVVQRCVVSGNVTGIFIEPGADGNAILANEITNNNRMASLTQGGDDDYGAFGILVNGDNTEIARNTLSGQDAFSYDYGRDGAAIEIDGARNTRVHHNSASNNDAFIELGGSRSADNTIYYNVVVSSLSTSSFIVTRGAGSWGPVMRTTVHNNTVVLTGLSSQGVYCSPGCGPSILSLRNNIIQANGTIVQANAAFDEDYNVFSGGRVSTSLGPNTVVANPQFMGNGDFKLASNSPAIDLGESLGYTVDFAGSPVPTDGDGNGSARPDVGAYEFRP